MAGSREGGSLGSYEYDLASRRWRWSPELFALHGLEPQETPTTELMLQRADPADRPVLLRRFETLQQLPGPYACAYRLTDAEGRQRRVVLVGESHAVDGRVTALEGYVVDITEAVREESREAVAAATEHRAVIEQAKGALILSFGVDDETAFALLRGYSNRYNIKLFEIASQIMDRLADPAYSGLGPTRSLLAVLSHLEHDPGLTSLPAAGQPRPGSAVQHHGAMPPGAASHGEPASAP